MRLGRQGTMQGNDIALGVELFQRDVFHAKLDAFGVSICVAGDEAAAETMQNARDRGPDAACADDADGLAPQFKAEQPLQGEISIAHAVICLGKMPVERQYQPHAMLGYGVRRVGGHAHHVQPQAGGDMDVHVIEARTAQCDQPGALPRQCFEHSGIERVVHEHAHGGKAGNDLPRFPVQAGIEEYQLMSKVTVGGQQNSRSYACALHTATFMGSP